MTIVTATFTARLQTAFDETLTADQLADMTAASVAYYSRYNPRLVEAELSIVEDTRLYDLPADFMFMRSFDYWPGGDASVSWSDDYLWDKVYKGARLAAEAGDLAPAYVVQGKQLLLREAPSDDEDVDYDYYGIHQEVDSSYSTIPTEDFEILLRLAIAETIERLGGKVALDPNVMEGLLDVNFRSVTDNIVTMTGHLRRGVKEKYGGY